MYLRLLIVDVRCKVLSDKTGNDSCSASQISDVTMSQHLLVLGIIMSKYNNDVMRGSWAQKI